MSKQRQVSNLRSGDRIKHFDINVGDNGEYVEGVVQSILSAQFTYLNPAGNSRFCMYSDDWETL